MSPMPQPIPQRLQGTLPPCVKNWLVEASQVKDAKARVIAVEEATARAQLLYPQYFQP
jgi:hypothetical protein